MRYKLICFIVLFAFFVSCDKIIVQESSKPSVDTLIKIRTLTPQNPVANQALTGGDISDDGGEDIIARGVCWALHENPTIKDSMTIAGRGTGIYQVLIKNLLTGRRYYAKAFATNKYGTVYGNRTSFIVEGKMPGVSFKSATATDVSIDITCYVSSNGGYPVTEQGVFFDSVGNPTKYGTKILAPLQNDTFTIRFSGLKNKSRYYFVPFVSTQLGSQIGVPGNTIYMVQTKIFPAPLVTTNSPTEITRTSITIGGNIVSTSPDGIQFRGIVYDTIPPRESLAEPSVNSGSGPGSFSVTLSKLEPNTRYYAKAFAKNSEGLVFGSLVTATTAP